MFNCSLLFTPRRLYRRYQQLGRLRLRQILGTILISILSQTLPPVITLAAINYRLILGILGSYLPELFCEAPKDTQMSSGACKRRALGSMELPRI